MNESKYRQISTIHNLGKYYFVFELICNITISTFEMIQHLELNHNDYLHQGKIF